MSNNIQKAKSLTITFLTPVSLSSLNGSDKETDNLSSIKKITRGTREYPYVSSQAIRRALRDQLQNLGFELSEGVAANQTKGAATTEGDPKKYIDDDLFGFMNAQKSKTTKRTSVVRVSPLLGLDPYEGDLDFGTNYMSVKAGGNPNIFETEIHSGLYRGTILIELDRLGKSNAEDTINDFEISDAEKFERVSALLTSLQNLWSSGRQSRFLADLSPKFVAVALTSVKTPLFLESVQLTGNKLDKEMLTEVLNDHKNVVIKSVFGARSGLFQDLPEETLSLGEAFEEIHKWMQEFFNVKE